jgi:hypothetical protein
VSRRCLDDGPALWLGPLVAKELRDRPDVPVVVVVVERIGGE